VSEHVDGAWADRARRDGFEMVSRREYTWRGRPAGNEEPPRRPPIARLVARVALSPSMPTWLRMAAAEAVFVAVTDVPLLERVTMRNYLYTNQDTVLQGWRNALLRRYGARAWCFTLAIGGGYLYLDDGRAVHRSLSFLNPDVVVTASAQMVAYYRAHAQRVGAYHAVGNIWAEVALDVERREDPAALRRQWFGGPVSEAVVAWFDTSFVQGDGSPSTYVDAIAWYRDLERFLDDFPHVRVVVKPSKDDAYFVGPGAQWADPHEGPVLMEIWGRLRAHPRVHFAGHRGDPCMIIAGSDIVITHCFSSVSAEALGAGRRALWYEAGERWRSVPYARVPGLVAHGYDELTARVRALLEVTDSAYRAYLDDHVRGVVEEFLDGRALTRFRRLLADAVETTP
jgi:polysaccharide biosynthesis PFTS motif protein